MRQENKQKSQKVSFEKCKDCSGDCKTCAYKEQKARGITAVFGYENKNNKIV